MLAPIPPTPGEPTAIFESPFWVGSDGACDLTIHHPHVASRHLVVVEREDGYWISAPNGAQNASVDGQPLTDPVLLAEGARVQVADGVVYQFGSGQVAEEVPPSRTTVRFATPKNEPEPAAPRPHPGKRRISKRTLTTLRGTAVGVLILGLLAAGGWAVGSALLSDPAPQPLSESDAQLFQELLRDGAEAMERGATLLELGLTDVALQEFAGALSRIETSRLAGNPWTTPRLAAMEEAIRELYQAKRVTAPGRFAGRGAGGTGAEERTRESGSVASAETMDLLFRSDVSPSDFRERTEDVFQRFGERFGSAPVTTGRDHPEHVSLYGRGGALDLRVRDLSTDEIAWLTNALRAMGLRVKDFSTDQILADQIRRATAAGLVDRAGTGLHLHVDRFASRSDRYSTTGDR